MHAPYAVPCSSGGRGRRLSGYSAASRIHGRREVLPTSALSFTVVSGSVYIANNGKV